MPSHKLRAVLDTSILVAGILQPDGPSGQVMRAFVEGRFTHVTSIAILDEMVDVLTREKIRRVMKLDRQEIANLRVALQQRAETAPGEYKDVDLVRSDPKDNPIVSAALEMQAQYVVTLDARDLLRLKVILVSGHRPIQIESPKEFLRLLERGDGPTLDEAVPLQPTRTSRRRAASAEQAEVRDARVAALKALGHSGEPEKHSRNVLRWLKNFGLVYEKTAARLLGVSVARLRRLVLPEDWIPNPAYSTAPRVPIYDPRTLLLIKQFVEKDPSLAKSGRASVMLARAQIDAEVREEYGAFISRARFWNERRRAKREEWLDEPRSEDP